MAQMPDERLKKYFYAFVRPRTGQKGRQVLLLSVGAEYG